MFCPSLERVAVNWPLAAAVESGGPVMVRCSVARSRGSQLQGIQSLVTDV